MAIFTITTLRRVTLTVFNKMISRANNTFDFSMTVLGIVAKLLTPVALPGPINIKTDLESSERKIDEFRKLRCNKGYLKH